MSKSSSTSSPPFYISQSTNSKGVSIGNGLFAGREFGAGEQITVIDRPLLGSLDTQYLHDTCANCYVWGEGAASGTRLYVPPNTKLSKCAGCQRFRYCSKVCGEIKLCTPCLCILRHVRRRPGTAVTSTSAKACGLTLTRTSPRLCWLAWSCWPGGSTV